MQRKKKKPKMNWILGGIIIFVMVSSAFGVMFGSFSNNTNRIKYKDYTFIYQNDGTYRSKIDGKWYVFEFTPDALENIPYEEGILKHAPQMDITYDYGSDYVKDFALFSFQLKQTLSGNKFVREGALAENEFGHEVITCADSTAQVPVVLLMVGNETKVYMDGNCIIAEASRREEIGVIRDRMLYEMLGVL